MSVSPIARRNMLGRNTIIEFPATESPKMPGNCVNNIIVTRNQMIAPRENPKPVHSKRFGRETLLFACR
jgi:hypothetical protein